MHESIKRIAEAADHGAFDTGGLQRLTTTHDDDCAINRGGQCDCDPDICLTSEGPGEWPADTPDPIAAVPSPAPWTRWRHRRSPARARHSA